MKKKISIVLIAGFLVAAVAITVFLLVGRVDDTVENNLAEQLKGIEEIESFGFFQDYYNGGWGDIEDCYEDVEAILNIFSQVSSDGEPFEEYINSFYVLRNPRMKIRYSSGEEVVINWKSGRGILVYNDVEYYIDWQKAKELYDIFTKYCPYYKYLM